MGRLVAWFSAGAAEVVFYRFQWVWDLGFWVFAGNPVTRAISQRLMTRLGGPGLMRLIADVDPGVIVSVYPNATEVLGRLRRSGRLRIPVVAAITDLAAMHYWASAGVDIHLVTHPESIDEVRGIVGPDAPCRACTVSRCPSSSSRARSLDARRALGLPDAGKVVLVSGGGWGVGDVEGAVVEALSIADVVCVVCLCGRNEDLRRRLLARFGKEARVRVEGFTEEMPEWLAAADVLVHSTGGLTVLEATDARLPGDLVRLGPRTRPREQPRVPPLRPRRRRRRQAAAPTRDRAGARERAYADRVVRRPTLGRLVRPRRRRCVVASLAAGGALAWFGPAAAPVFPPVARVFGIPLHLPEHRGIAITFDDGPHREGTPAMLEILDRHDVRATFFLVGEQVTREPALAAEIAAAGHEVAVHGYRHVLLLRRSPGAIRDDFAARPGRDRDGDRCAPTLYRPPYGVFSGPALAHRARAWAGGRCSGHAGDATGRRRATSESIAARATRGLGAGDVVLLHDADHYSSAGSWRKTAAALPAVLEAAAATGEPFVTVSQST